MRTSGQVNLQSVRQFVRISKLVDLINILDKLGHWNIFEYSYLTINISHSEFFPNQFDSIIYKCRWIELHRFLDPLLRTGDRQAEDTHSDLQSKKFL